MIISFMIEQQVNQLLNRRLATAISLALLCLTILLFTLFKLLMRWFKINGYEGAFI